MSREASPSLEQPGEEEKEDTAEMDKSSEEAAAADQESAPITAVREEPQEGQRSMIEWRQLRQVRGRHRAALTRIFRRAETLIADRASRAQLGSIREEIDSAFQALLVSHDCICSVLQNDEEREDEAQYLTDVRTEMKRIEDKIEAGLCSTHES